MASHAKWCCENYLTIVNNIPKEQNVYHNTLKDYAKVDNATASSQMTIGESSNLSQICLTYSYNFDDDKYEKYCCILAVLAQVSIDNAKRKFDINLSEEINRIKEDMNIKENKYPSFWATIRRDFKQSNINKNLVCPMNCLENIKFKEKHSDQSTLPMSTFFKKFSLDVQRKKCMKVEELISKYSLNVMKSVTEGNADRISEMDYFVLRSDFNDLVEDIRKVPLSKNYLGLMSWLIDRAFLISPNIRSNKNNIDSQLDKNKAILLNVLYQVNKENFLACFSNNITN